MSSFGRKRFLTILVRSKPFTESLPLLEQRRFRSRSILPVIPSSQTKKTLKRSTRSFKSDKSKRRDIGRGIGFQCDVIGRVMPTIKREKPNYKDWNDDLRLAFRF
jgi:hypothetical protein